MDIWKNCYIHSECYQSSVSSSGGCSFSSFCFFYSSSLFAAFIHAAELELKIFRLGKWCLWGCQGQWSVTAQQFLVKPMLVLENRVSDIPVETCLLSLSNILLCAGCQQDIAAGPNITRFLLFFQLQMRSCPEKREAGNWHFVFMTAKWRKKEAKPGVLRFDWEVRRFFLVAVWTLCPETHDRLSWGY